MAKIPEFKIGFACKFHSNDRHEAAVFNFNTVTVKSLKNLSPSDRVVKLHTLALNNINKLESLLNYVNTLDEPLKMFRIGSDLYPLYTHALAKDAYSDYDFKLHAEDKLAKLGEFARLNNIRLSMHPGQFTVLGSLNSNVVANSISELEYHTDIFRHMGYSGWHANGLAINIHGGSGKVPLEIFINNVKRCSTECRNWITVENDEFSFDIKSLCTLAKEIAIVPDLHHEWIHTGLYREAADPLFNLVLESWRGIRPKLHCAMSREELFVSPSDTDIKPSLDDAIARGLNKSMLRAHSDSSWNNALVDYYATFLATFDIMCEMKFKQIGASTLYSKIVNRS